jgi:hypothetical protein
MVTRPLPALYIPRGYISTQQAVARLIEARQQWPKELGAIQRTVRGLQSAAVRDIRSALAEGDISAILLTNNGVEFPISVSRWRATDGLVVVQTGRVDVQLPFGVGTTEGQALIKEIDFITWLSTNAPKPFSQVSVSLSVQNQASHNQAAKPRVSTPSLVQPAVANDTTAADQPQTEAAGDDASPNAPTSPRNAPPSQARSVGTSSPVVEADRTRLIPIEDRKRELIVARHTARVQRIYGPSRSKESAPAEPSVYPVFLASEDVIGLIAYGRTTALRHPAPGEPPFFERWNSELMFGDSSERQHPLVRGMRLVLARVRWWQLSKRRHDNLVHCPIRPLDRVSRSHVRWAIRHNNRTAVGTIGLLRTDVRQLIAAREAHEITIERATAILCAEIAAEKFVAWGRPGVWRSRRFKSGIHKEIPFIFFANPHNTIQSDGWATCGWDVTVQHWTDWDGPDWGDVRFRRDDIFKLWPPTRPADDAIAGTAAATTEVTEWLTVQMRNSPQSPRPKSVLKSEAVEAGLRRISDRSFDTAYGTAVRASGALAWSKGGRRPKSPR